jgi:hypothetical protein
MTIRDELSIATVVKFDSEGGQMKTNPRFRRTMEPAQVAVLLGLAVGLGIAVHESFFVVAGAIALGAIVVATANAVHDAGRAGLAHGR